jgi:hypothetical protein
MAEASAELHNVEVRLSVLDPMMTELSRLRYEAGRR